jgi:hypothetical protein
MPGHWTTNQTKNDILTTFGRLSTGTFAMKGSDYRKIYKDYYECIPTDETGRTFDIHAICSCPTGQVPAATTFLTEAGQGNPDACAQYPVSLPIQNPPGN